MNAKEKYVCGTCKYNYTKDCFVYQHRGVWLNDYATCGGWTDPAESELTEEERYDGGVMSNFDNENTEEGGNE
jgi:hypothetical protein